MNDKQGTFGFYCSQDELVEECLKDISFYTGKLPFGKWEIDSVEQLNDLPGGVTFSGGESLLQMPALAPVCHSLHENKVHIAVETCLFIPTDYLLLGLENVDLFYVDLKIVDGVQCKRIINGDIGLFHNNIEKLFSWTSSNNVHKPVVVRIPVIGTYTDYDANRRDIFDFVARYKDFILKVEMIKEHDLGSKKYEYLGLKSNYHGVSDDMIDKYYVELDTIGIPIEVCKI